MSVEAGGAFICNTEDLTGDNEHLWVIISDPTAYPESVVVVNLSSCSDNRRYDSACVLKAGDHWYIRHDTFVYYREAKILTVQELNDADISHKTSVTPRVLSRIR